MALEVMLSAHRNLTFCHLRALCTSYDSKSCVSQIYRCQRTWRSSSASEQRNSGEENEGKSEVEDPRDISRLPKRLHDRMHHVFEPPESLVGTRNYLRGLYARMGERSGVDPAIMWPTIEELKEMKADGEEWEPNLEEMWERIASRKEEEKATRTKKEELVNKQMAKMPEYIAQFKARLDKEDDAVSASENKRRALLEEAREYFGYRIHPKDPRFKQMLEKKAEEEEIEKKRKKKLEKKANLAKAMEQFKQSVK